MEIKKTCDFMTGIEPPKYRFVADVYSNGGAVEFFIDADCEVDWGDGQVYLYEAGVVHGFPKNYDNSYVKIKSSGIVKKVYFGDGTSYNNAILQVHIHRASDLEDASRLCYRLESMTHFSFFGTNKVTTFESAWEGCTELIEFKGMATTRATTFRRAWKDNSKLQVFPSIYSKSCESVEEAWRGCTSMLWFPSINVENCINFNMAWYGNVKLEEFPIIDTSKGKYFQRAWAYCINLLDFPTLDFSSAEDMSYAFAYNYRIERMPALNTDIATNFDSLFENNIALKCITHISTINQQSTSDMFKRTDSLAAPDRTEQYNLTVGDVYTNQNPCAYNAGRSRFFAIGATNGNLTTIKITGGAFEIDWGTGIFLPYNGGTVSGLPVGTGIVSIRSEERITAISIETDTFKTFSIKRGKDIETLDDLFYNKSAIEEFSIENTLVNCRSMNNMLRNASSLKRIPGEIKFDYVESASHMMDGCTSFVEFDPMYSYINLSRCKDFSYMFNNMISIKYYPVIVSSYGEDFSYMFANNSSLQCVWGIDTRRQTNTDNMFIGCTNLVRPTANEVTRIKAGTDYSNNGNCFSPLVIEFKANGQSTFTVDGNVDVDWGDGNFVASGPGAITGTPTGICYIIGDSTSISFDTDTFTDVTFYVIDNITSMKDMFKGKQNITNVAIKTTNQVKTMESMFEGSSIVKFEAINEGLASVESFNSMFKDTPKLNSVGKMNTYNGKDFEHMFENTAITCIGRINTVVAVFPAHNITCSQDLVCTDDIKCFGSSTMFDNSPGIQSPNSIERDMIMTRYDFVSPIC